MCGLTGILNVDRSPIDRRILEEMTVALAHRGPDGQGVWMEGPIGLGHRRLSIIDLTTAASQPMVIDDGRFVLAYNGELYNFKDLQIELERLNHKFSSRSDTEVVLRSLAQWGVKAIERFNGMFALALWDAERGELILARDRYGVKPLYWTRAKNTFLFGSEVKSILRHPQYMPSMDKQALLEYFTFQNFFTEKTLFKDVNLLPAGHWMKVRLDGNVVTKRYWDFDFRSDGNGLSETECVEEIDRLVRQSLDRQLVSDVEVGSYLSGGMDSATLTALAARELPYIKTFTAGFDLSSASGLELGFDERAAAERISYLYKTEHYEIVLKAGDMERCLPKLVWHLEEPRVGQSYPNFYIAQLASKFCKVVLAGTGGDEIFAGYPWRYLRGHENLSFEQFVDHYYKFWQRLIPNSEIHRVFKPIEADVSGVWTRDIFRDVLTDHRRPTENPEDYVNQSLYFEAKTFLHGLLVVEDKLSMAHGLETRVPFLDNDLVDFAMQIPISMKLGRINQIERLDENVPGASNNREMLRRRDGKQILRNTMRRYIPEDVTGGEKKGFSGPDASWFRGESIDFVRDTLFNGKDAAIFEFLDYEAVHDLVGEHLTGQHNRRLFIWSLLMVEFWCRTFLKPAAAV